MTRVPKSARGRGVVERPEDVLVHRDHVGGRINVDVDSPFVRLALTPEVARVLLVGIDEALG